MFTDFYSTPQISRSFFRCFLLIFLLCVGCSTTSNQTHKAYRAHTDLFDKWPGIQTVVLLPPKIHVYELSPGGIQEEDPKRNETARSHVVSGLTRWWKVSYSNELLQFSEDNMSSEVKDNVEETQALYDVINNAILTHTYGGKDHTFPEQVTNLNYTLGSEVSGIDPRADAYLLVRGFDQEATTGRKVQEVAKSIMFGVMMAFLGVIAIPSDVDPSVTGLSAALVDARTGNLLWYNIQIWRGGYEFTNPDSAYGLVQQVLGEFPIK